MLTILLAIGTISVGADGPVPPGVALPAAHGQAAHSGCALAGPPRTLCPNPASLFLADFAFDFERRRFLVVDVPAGGDGLFWWDPDEGTVDNYVSYAGVSQRGCAFDNMGRVAYTAGWNDAVLWRLDENLEPLGNQPLDHPVAGLAINEPERRLYAAVTGFADSLLEYEIHGDGSVSESGRRWVIPWDGAADGHAAAGLDYDEATGTFLILNQDAGQLEFFRIAGSRLLGTGACPVALDQPWGFGIDLAKAEVHIATRTASSCESFLVPVSTDPPIEGWSVDPWQVRLEPAPPTSVAGFHTPYSVRVYNNGEVARGRSLWLDVGGAAPIALGSWMFEPGSTRVFGSGPTSLPEGRHPVVLGLTPSPTGELAASDSAWVTVVGPGPDRAEPPGSPKVLPSGLAALAPFQSGEPGPAPQSGDSVCVAIGETDRVHPRPGSVYVADMAYDAEFERFAVVDVPFLSDGIFWMSAVDYTVGGYTSYAGVSQRGCAFDPSTRQVYTAGWNDETLWRLDDTFRVRDAQFIGEPVAGLAVDPVARRLYAATSSAVDEIVVFALGEDGRAIPTGERWEIPWGWSSDGYSAGGLEFDPLSGTFAVVNQDARSLEYFTVVDSALTWAGACGLPASTPWGVAFDETSRSMLVTDASFGDGVSILHSIEAQDGFLGDLDLPDWSLRASEGSPFFVGNGGGPVELTVANRTASAADKTFWAVFEDAPSMAVFLAQEEVQPGENRLWTGIRPLAGRELSAGTYHGAVHMADSLGGVPDATAPFSMEIVAPGIR